MAARRLAVVCAALFMASTAVVKADELSAPPAPPEASPRTSFSASVYAYLVPDDTDYLQPTLTADRGRLHLEARYNYEERETSSFWAGMNLSAGKALTLDFTAMLGVVTGKTDGVAPGYHLSLEWRWLNLYSESEYVWAGALEDSYFYTWSEATASLAGGVRAGIVTQRTRAYESDLYIQRGVLVGVTYKQLSVTGHVFNPDRGTPLWVVAVGWRSGD